MTNAAAVLIGIVAGAAPVLALAQAPVAPPSARLALVASDETAADDSPLRVTLAQELSYKVESPERIIKNRSSLQVEYSKYLLEHFFIQFNGKASAYLGQDHRRAAQRSDIRATQAYVQTSFGKTSIKAGIQTLPWGESVLAPVTDEVSPRDNRELFNFNLEELRLGQPMVVVDQYSAAGRWTGFYTPRATYNKNPERGSAYFFDPLVYGTETGGKQGGEYGVSWRKNFEGADLTLMGASLLENDYAVRMTDAGLAARQRHRFSMAGVVVNVAFKDFVVRGEAALKSGRAYNDAALQIVEKDAVDTYLALDYRYSPTLSFGVEAVNQHVAGRDRRIASVPRDRQSLLLSATKLLMNDDLSINVMNIHNRPQASHLTVLIGTFKWDDHLTFGLNIVYPHSRDRNSGLWNVRDQKQIGFKAQYQF